MGITRPDADSATHHLPRVRRLALLFRSSMREPTLLTALGAALTLLLPALFFGPWLPFIDLVSFVGMNAYPPQMSYGPLHYYTFQFTYAGHYALSRLLTDLHVSVPWQILTFYLLQVTVCFTVVYRSLTRLVENPWWRCVGIALGTLAFWDGVFLWGGPLAFSLAGACVTLATFLTMQEASQPEIRSGLLITLLLGFAIFCHPFAAFFGLVVCGLRFLFVCRRRWQTLLLVGGIIAYAFVIIRDSPPSEASASGSLAALFGFSLHQIGLRLTNLFVRDEEFMTALFASTPWPSRLLFWLYGFLHLSGFLLSPLILWRERTGGWRRMLATLNTAIGIIYLFSWEAPDTPIPEWPQRILTLYAPFTFLGGFVGWTYIYALWRRRSAPEKSTFVPRLAWLLPPALLVYLVVVQTPVLALGSTIAAHYHKVRDGILQSKLSNAYIVVSGMDNVRPFYLRSIPFLLFSDRDLIARHLTFATEWHFQDRHPSKLTEIWFNLGRKRYLAQFAAPKAVLSVNLIEQPSDRFPVIEKTDQVRWASATDLASIQFDQGTELFGAGIYLPAWEHFNTAAHLDPKNIEAWNDAGAALYHAEKISEAESYFNEAIKRAPTNVDARINLIALLVGAGRGKEAIPHLEAILKVQPDSAVARTWLQKLRGEAASGR